MKQFISSFVVKLIQRFGPRTVAIDGKTYVISRAVFNPKFYGTSTFMAEQIQATPEDRVLDIGTGAGIQAVTAAQKARMVVAVDINPEAVQCAEENVKRNGVSHIVIVLKGDLFSPLNQREKFDIILFTPPYFEGTVRTDFDHALYDPAKTLAERFFREAKLYLKHQGYVQMVYSSLAGPESVLEIAAEHGWQYHVVAEKPLRFETLFVYRLILKN
jgi:release factor glutamine methyltransferase